MLALLPITVCARSLSTEQVYKLLTSWSELSEGLGKSVESNRFVLSMTTSSRVRFTPVDNNEYKYYLRTVDNILTLTNVS